MAVGALDGGRGTLRFALGAVAIGALTAFALPLARRAIVVSDEGFLLQQSLEMLGGAVLYRDLVTIVAPGAWLLVAGLFSIVEPSVFATRMLALATYLATAIATYRIVAASSGTGHAIGAVATLMVLTVWAFPAWTLAWYSPLAIAFALWGIERLATWNRDRATRNLFGAGALFALSMLCKQNYGALALMGALAALLAIRWSQYRAIRPALPDALRDVAAISAGGALVTAPLIAYYAAVGALPQLVDSLLLQPGRFAATSDIPFLPLSELVRPEQLVGGISKLVYGAIPLNVLTLPDALQTPLVSGGVARLHALLFWLPVPVLLLGGFAACSRLPREKTFDDEALIVWLSCGGLFLGVLPRADFAHLMAVYAPIVVLGSVVWQRCFDRCSSGSRWAQIGQASLVAAIALYALVSVVWYAGLVRFMSTPVDLPRGGVRVSAPLAASLLRQVGDIRARTRSDEPVLSVPDLAMLNFLADRPFVGGTHEMYEHMIGDDRGQSIVDAAEARGVRLAVTRFNDFFSHRVGLREYATPLAGYLRSHFRPAYYRDDENFMLLERRAAPLDQQHAASVLADCDAETDAIASREIKHHLLFDGLYHRIPPASMTGAAPLRSVCHVRIPERAAFRVEVGYRPPESAEPGAMLTAFVWARLPTPKGRGDELLLRESFSIDSDAPSRPFVAERWVDLSHLAGREVSLVFGTDYRGRVTPRGDYLAYSMVWLDPRIVVRGYTTPTSTPAPRRVRNPDEAD